MGLRVWDNRKSECCFVMKWIRIETLFGVKASQLRYWSLSTRKVAESDLEKKANESTGNISWCASHCENRNGRQFGIAGGGGGSRRVAVKGAFQRLEPDAVKVASPVLRGRSGGNVTLLPDSRQRVS